jgi:hypothetical protein
VSKILQQQLQELEAIAKEACAIAYSEFGTGWEKVTLNINAYTADGRNHQAAKIFDIGVSLFSPAKYDFTAVQILAIKKIVADARAELDAYKKELRARGTSEVEKKKQERIEALKAQIKDLEKA